MAGLRAAHVKPIAYAVSCPHCATRHATERNYFTWFPLDLEQLSGQRQQCKYCAGRFVLPRFPRAKQDPVTRVGRG